MSDILFLEKARIAEISEALAYGTRQLPMQKPLVAPTGVGFIEERIQDCFFKWFFHCRKSVFHKVDDAIDVQVRLE